MLTGSHYRADRSRGRPGPPGRGLDSDRIDRECRIGRRPAEPARRFARAALPAALLVILTLSTASAVGQAQETRPAAAKPPSGPKPAQPVLPVNPAAPGAAPPAATPPVKPSPPLGPPTAAPLPGEVGPAEYLVRDKEGKFQHLLNFTFEDFIQLYKLQHKLEQQDQQPRYVLEDIELSGTAETQYAELKAEFAVDVRDSGWVRVPLRLPGAILRHEAEFSGGGEHLLNFEGPQEGFVCWIRSEPGKVHKIALKLLVPLVSVGGENQLKLNLPRAARSQLKLEVAADNAQARVSDGSELLKTEPAAGGKTALTVLRIGGDFELAWHAAEGNVATVPTRLEATGALLARIDGRSVNTEARLTVRSFAGQFDRFRLRLPPGAELVGANQPGVQLVPVESQDAGGKLIEVKLGRKTAGPVELRLVTERPHNVAQGDELLELAGFEVLGAVRQWGNIAVQVVGDWQVAWGSRRNVRQVDDLPEGLRREDLTAGFEYYVQPCSLTARVVPQKTRSSVEPEYVVLVSAQQAQLQAHLKYTVRGAKLRALDIDLRGWELDEVGPSGLINPDASLAGEADSWSIPLAQALAGQFEITLRAHRTIEPGERTISFDLPRPHADTLSQALLAVLPADNVELSPDLEATFGLSAQTLKPAIKLPERQQDPLFYRVEGTTAGFGATFRVHEQTITADSLSTLSIGEQAVNVEQRLAFQVAYEPVDTLNINVPRSLPLDSLSVTLDGQRLTTIARSDPGAQAEDLTPVRLLLPGPRIGRLELKINYSVAHDKLSPVSSLSLAVPLVTPGFSKLGYNQIHVASQPGLQVTPREGPWKAEANSAAAPSGLVLASRQAPAELVLALALKQRQTEGKTIVECGWIQTLLADTGRQDRAVYRFKSGEQELRIALPAGAELHSLDARLDGKAVSLGETTTRGEFVISLTGLSQGEHVLELRYYFLDYPLSGRLSADPPEFRPSTWVRRLYWELLLPGKQHLVVGPTHFINESTLQRDGLVWRRRPALDQSELEALVGGGASMPEWAGSNRYLFSTVGMVTPLDVWVVSRSVLVFVASLLLLTVGLAFIYFPRVRHPALILALALVVFAGSLIQPETALLLAQAGSLGVVLAVVAAGLARRTLRRSLPPQWSRGSSRAKVDRSVTEAYFRSIKSSPSSTATAPAALQISSPESQS
jgi:hypothetical protein